MNPATESTTVAIIGGGVAGLALGNFLLRSGIDCIIVERRSRRHVEQRQRAGSLDGNGVRLLQGWGLSEVIDAGVPHIAHAFESSGTAGMPLLIDGQVHRWRLQEDDESGVFCTQQVLVRNLIETFVRNGGDLRFESADVCLDVPDGARPLVAYRDAAGVAHQISCDFVAGCDGDRGVSKTSVPPGAFTRYAHEYGYAWLAVLADVPAEPPAVMAIHSRGFAAQITRGTNVSRFYLQCALSDTVDHWPDERIWAELAARFERPMAAIGPTTDKQVIPLRGVVHSPMNVGRLYLLGDAAHIVSPMSAKGMSLALHDADVFARAVIRQVKDGDTALLQTYSDTCLRHTWATQSDAVWITDVMHNAGDSTHSGEFGKQLARNEIERMLRSPSPRNPF